jgi:uroporphyrinogen-III synthase
MRDDHSKQIEELKDKTNHTEQYDEIISTSPTTVNILFSKKKNNDIKLIFVLVNK